MTVHILNPLLERRRRWTEDDIEYVGSMCFVACSCGWYRWVRPDRDAQVEGLGTKPSSLGWGLYGLTEAEDAWIAHIEEESVSAFTRNIACESTG
jgi:hypothetical protein